MPPTDAPHEAPSPRARRSLRRYAVLTFVGGMVAVLGGWSLLWRGLEAQGLGNQALHLVLGALGGVAGVALVCAGLAGWRTS